MRFDIVVKDAAGRDVLLVEVKGTPVDDARARSILDEFKLASISARFGMIVDPNWIRVGDLRKDTDSTVRFTLSTPEVLRAYDPEVGTKRIFQNYLTTLVETWLMDFTIHWTTDTPPAKAEFSSIGLVDLIDGGDTSREVMIEADPVH